MSISGISSNNPIVSSLESEVHLAMNKEINNLLKQIVDALSQAETQIQKNSTGSDTNDTSAQNDSTTQVNSDASTIISDSQTIDKLQGYKQEIANTPNLSDQQIEEIQAFLQSLGIKPSTN